MTNAQIKTSVTVRPDGGSIKACFSRRYFADGKQVKLGTGIPINNWESLAERLQRRLQIELEDGKLSNNGVFNIGRYQEILEEYGLRAKLKVVKTIVDTPNKIPEVSLLEIWEIYLSYIKPNLKGSTYHKQFESRFTNFINSAIVATKSEDALKIRNWLVEHRETLAVKGLLRHLSKAHELSIKHNRITINPYRDMAEEIKQIGDNGKKNSEVEIDNDVLDKTKAYTWDEIQIILDYISSHNRLKHWYPFVKFKTITGVRTGEAIAFMHGDILWDKQQILIRRNYDINTKSFYNTKTSKGDSETIRVFPMPKKGELWNLLADIPSDSPNSVVFKSRRGGGVINPYTFFNMWHGKTNPYRDGVIPALIREGKLSKYLPPYNTRHSSITHQIYDLGRDPKILAAWCGHSELISERHYQDIVNLSLQINPDISANKHEEIEQLKEELREQKEVINKLINKT